MKPQDGMPGLASGTEVSRNTYMTKLTKAQSKRFDEIVESLVIGTRTIETTHGPRVINEYLPKGSVKELKQHLAKELSLQRKELVEAEDNKIEKAYNEAYEEGYKEGKHAQALIDK